MLIKLFIAALVMINALFAALNQDIVYEGKLIYSGSEVVADIARYVDTVTSLKKYSTPDFNNAKYTSTKPIVGVVADTNVSAKYSQTNTYYWSIQKITIRTPRQCPYTLSWYRIPIKETYAIVIVRDAFGELYTDRWVGIVLYYIPPFYEYKDGDYCESKPLNAFYTKSDSLAKIHEYDDTGYPHPRFRMIKQVITVVSNESMKTPNGKVFYPVICLWSPTGSSYTENFRYKTVGFTLDTLIRQDSTIAYYSITNDNSRVAKIELRTGKLTTEIIPTVRTRMNVHFDRSNMNVNESVTITDVQGKMLNIQSKLINGKFTMPNGVANGTYIVNVNGSKMKSFKYIHR